MSPAKGEKLIEVKGLEKHFKHVEVLRGINIDICKGDVVAVIGPSGSGKSTFLRCLNLLEEPTGGQIVFEGVDITDPRRQRSTRCARRWAWCSSSSICSPT